MEKAEAELRIKLDNLIKLNEKFLSGVSVYTAGLLGLITEQNKFIEIQKKFIETLTKNDPDARTN